MDFYRLARFFAVTSIFLAVIATNVLGLPFHTFTTQMGNSGTMTGCMFMAQGTICKMSPFAHLSLWQASSLSVPNGLLILLALALVITFMHGLQRHLRLQTISTVQRFYYHRKPSFSFSDYIQQAFSQGILHAKIY